MAANNEQTLQVGTSSKEKNVEEEKEESKVCKIYFFGLCFWGQFGVVSFLFLAVKLKIF